MRSRIRAVPIVHPPAPKGPTPPHPNAPPSPLQPAGRRQGSGHARSCCVGAAGHSPIDERRGSLTPPRRPCASCAAPPWLPHTLTPAPIAASDCRAPEPGSCCRSARPAPLAPCTGLGNWWRRCSTSAGAISRRRRWIRSCGGSCPIESAGETCGSPLFRRPLTDAYGAQIRPSSLVSSSTAARRG
jgi:hypothetical protein